jgi:predicted nucleic acid-binding protein
LQPGLAPASRRPSIYKPPTPLPLAIDQIDAWLASPSLVLVGEAEGYWERLKPLLEGGLIEGAKVHDARVAAICLLHGVSELWSADRDFSRFPDLKAVNPLV